MEVLDQGDFHVLVEVTPQNEGSSINNGLPEPIKVQSNFNASNFISEYVHRQDHLPHVPEVAAEGGQIKNIPSEDNTERKKRRESVIDPIHHDTVLARGPGILLTKENAAYRGTEDIGDNLITKTVDSLIFKICRTYNY